MCCLNSEFVIYGPQINCVSVGTYVHVFNMYAYYQYRLVQNLRRPSRNVEYFNPTVLRITMNQLLNIIHCKHIQIYLSVSVCIHPSIDWLASRRASLSIYSVSISISILSIYILYLEKKLSITHLPSLFP